MPNYSDTKHHVIIRCNTPDKENPVTEQVMRWYEAMKCKIVKLLIGYEVGDTDKHWHYHCHIEFPKPITNVTVRNNLKLFITTPKSTRISQVKDEQKAQVYTLKGMDPVFQKGYEEDEIQSLKNMWDPSIRGKKATHPVDAIIQYMEQNGLDKNYSKDVVTATVDYYINRRKGFNEHQVRAIATEVYLIDNPRGREWMINKISVNI